MAITPEKLIELQKSGGLTQAQSDRVDKLRDQGRLVPIEQLRVAASSAMEAMGAGASPEHKKNVAGWNDDQVRYWVTTLFEDQARASPQRFVNLTTNLPETVIPRRFVEQRDKFIEQAQAAEFTRQKSLQASKSLLDQGKQLRAQAESETDPGKRRLIETRAEATLQRARDARGRALGNTPQVTTFEDAARSVVGEVGNVEALLRSAQISGASTIASAGNLVGLVEDDTLRGAAAERAVVGQDAPIAAGVGDFAGALADPVFVGPFAAIRGAAATGKTAANLARLEAGLGGGKLAQAVTREAVDTGAGIIADATTGAIQGGARDGVAGAIEEGLAQAATGAALGPAAGLPGQFIGRNVSFAERAARADANRVARGGEIIPQESLVRRSDVEASRETTDPPTDTPSTPSGDGIQVGDVVPKTGIVAMSGQERANIVNRRISEGVSVEVANEQMGQSVAEELARMESPFSPGTVIEAGPNRYMLTDRVAADGSRVWENQNGDKYRFGGFARSSDDMVVVHLPKTQNWLADAIPVLEGRSTPSKEGVSPRSDSQPRAERVPDTATAQPQPSDISPGRIARAASNRPDIAAEALSELPVENLDDVVKRLPEDKANAALGPIESGQVDTPVVRQRLEERIEGRPEAPIDNTVPNKIGREVSPGSARTAGFFDAGVLLTISRGTFGVLFRLANTLRKAESSSLIDRVTQSAVGNSRPARQLARLAQRQVDRTQRRIGKFQQRLVRLQRLTNRHFGANSARQTPLWDPSKRYADSRGLATDRGDILDNRLTQGEIRLRDEVRRVNALSGLEFERSGALIQVSRMEESVDPITGAVTNNRVESLVPFKHDASGTTFMANLTPEFYDLLITGADKEGFSNLVAGIAERNGLDEGIVRGQLLQMREDMIAKNITQPVTPSDKAPGLKTIGAEFMRQWEFIPAYVRGDDGIAIKLLEDSAIRSAESQVRQVAHRASFIEVFGQDIGDTTSRFTQLSRQLAREGIGNGAATIAGLGRAMHDVPAFPVTSELAAEFVKPGTVRYSLARSLNGIYSVLKAMQISRAFIPNIPEPIGNIGVYVGYRRMMKAGIKALATKEGRSLLRGGLSRMGAITDDVMDWTIDSKGGRFFESVSKKLSGVISRASLLKFMNEAQEKFGAIASVEMVADMKAGKAGAFELDYLTGFLKFDEATAKRMISGAGKRDEYITAINRSSRFLTGSIAQKAELSSFANRRIYQTLIPFTQYFQNTMRQFSMNIENMADAVKSGDRQKMARAAEKNARFIAGKTASGMVANLALATMTGGLDEELAEMKKQWNDRDFLGLFGEAFVFSTFGGVWGGMINAFNRSGSTDDLVKSIAQLPYPVALGSDIARLMIGEGPYRDQDWQDRTVRFMERHAPMLDTVPAQWGLSLIGAGYKDKQLDASMDAYWRWRFENAPPPSVEARGGRTDFNALMRRESQDHQTFRQNMRKAFDLINNGEHLEANKLMIQSLLLPTKDAASVRRSILNRQVLTPLNDNQKLDLKETIGDEAYLRLTKHDLILQMTAARF